MLASELLRRLLPTTDGVKVVLPPALILGAEAPVGAVVVPFRSVPFDLAAATTGTIVCVPAVPGFYCEAILASGWLTAGSGTCTVAPVLQGGNNAGEDNILGSSSPSVAAVNAAIAAGFPSKFLAVSIPLGTTAKQLLNMSTPATIKVTTPAAGTGGFTLTGYTLIAASLRAV